VSDGSYSPDSGDVRNNLIELQEAGPVATSRSSHELPTYRPSKELVQEENSSAVSKKPQARTLSISSILGGEKEAEDTQAASLSATGEIAPLNDHPLWKVHKYQGIDLTPVALPTVYEPPSESYGPSPETYGAVNPSSPSESYGPPTDTYGPPQPSGSTTTDTSAALSALDNLSGLTSILPEDGSPDTSSLSAISSLASLLPQKSNTGLSFEQLSALATLVRLLQAKPSGPPASTYGPPELPSNTRDTDLSYPASLVSLLPAETASSSGSLLTRLRSFLARRPAFLTSLLNALSISKHSKTKGAFRRFLEPNIVHPLSTMKDSSNFASRYNTSAKFTGNTAESKIGTKRKITKHIVLGNFSLNSGKVGKLGVINGHLPLKLIKILKERAISKLGKLSDLKLIKHKVPWKVATLSKPQILKAVSGLGKLSKHSIIKGHFTPTLHLVNKFSGLKNHAITVFRKKYLPLKAAVLSVPFRVKKHFFSKLNKFAKIGIPLKLSILGKSVALKGHILSKLVKFGIIKSYIPLKVLGKFAAAKNKFLLKLIQFSTGAKRIKYGILVAPIAAKKHIISKLKALGKSVEGIKSSLPSKHDVLIAPLKLKYNLISKLKSDSESSDNKHSYLKWGLLSKIPGFKGKAEYKERKFGHQFLSKSGGNNRQEASRKDDQVEQWKPIRGNDGHILNHIPNSFLGSVPAADVANTLDLPDLPPISIPSNYKFQETGVGRPYVLKYSQPAPSTAPGNTYGQLQHDALPIYEAAQPQQEVSIYPALNAASTHEVPVPALPTYGPAQGAAAPSFQPTHSPSQQSFNSFLSPTVSYPISVQEPRNPINSYGESTSPYGAVSSETNYANSGFQTEYQNQFYKQAAQTPPTDASVTQDVYSVPQQNNVQPQVDGTSLAYGSYPGAQSGPHPPSHSGLLPGTSRSDTDVPSDDVPSKRRSDFRPSTRAAATGAGYSRVVFQHSQQGTSYEHGPARQAGSEVDLATTSTTDVVRSAGVSTSSAGAKPAATSEQLPLHKENGFRPDINEFHMAQR
jgi:hypothetical protein